MWHGFCYVSRGMVRPQTNRSPEEPVLLGQAEGTEGPSLAWQSLVLVQPNQCLLVVVRAIDALWRRGGVPNPARRGAVHCHSNVTTLE